MNSLHATRQQTDTGGFAAKALFFAVAALLVSTHAQGQVDDEDTIIFENGDRLTGEVKRLDRGRLYFETDATGTIPIEWDNVAYLTSSQLFEIEMQSGLLFLGTVTNGDESYQIRVTARGETVDVPMIEVISLTAIEQTVVGGLDIDVDLGYSFTKASELARLNVNTEVSYRRERNGFRLSLETVLTDELIQVTDENMVVEEIHESSKRQNLNFSYDRHFDNRWFATGLMGFERNDELGLDLRTSFGGARGRFLAQTNRHTLSLLGGLVLTREEIDGENQPPGAELTLDGVEAMGGIRADWFRYDEPEFDFSMEFILFPSLTESGRIRGELDTSIRWEIVSDFFWGFTLYHSYDSEPQGVDANKVDYGVTTSVGWSF